jgi:hypothetical protein
MRILGTIASSSREVPNAPTIGTATDVGTSRTYTPQNGGATVTFTAPTWTGGLPILDYTATSSPGGFTATGAGSPLTVNGLAPSTLYSFTVKARNAVGLSAASAASNNITATTVPQAPTIGTATATGATTATVAFTANATGGKTITSYTATSSPGGITASGATSPITVTGLTSGTAYTFTVTASNANGTSLASGSSNSVTPVVPGYIFTYARNVGSGNQECTIAGSLSNGNTVVVTTLPVSNQPGSFYILNGSGVIQTQRRLSGYANLGIFGGCVDNSDNIIMGGYGDDNARAGLYKVSSSGTVIWAKRDTGIITGYNFGKFNVDSSNNIYFRHTTLGTVNGSQGWSSTDTNGNVRYNRQRANGRSVSYAIGDAVGDSSGQMYFCSTSSSVAGTNIAKTDNIGNVTSSVPFQTSSGGILSYSALTIDSSGNLYMLLNAPNPARYITVKLDNNLNVLWQREISYTESNSYPFNESITVDSNGDVYSLFPTRGNTSGTSLNYWTIAKYNSSGTLQWQRIWHSSSYFPFNSNQLSMQSIILNGTDYIISVPLNNGGSGTFRAPKDGSKTGAYSLGGVTYTYSASSWSSATGSLVAGSFDSYSSQLPSYSTLSGVSTVAGTQSTELLSI